MDFKICHLYPDLLNLYGDTGNISCLKYRLQKRGINCTVDRLPVEEKASLSGYDFIFIGGGQDFEQEVLLPDLKANKAAEILDAINDGITFLTICGGYQMLGQYYETHDGIRCDFLGAADFYTKGADTRMIGNFAFKLDESIGDIKIVGFENHSGKTYLGSGISPLGKIIKGYGNNGEDGTEGIHFKNVFGSYSHGPILPKNPEFCDLLIKTALERKYGSCALEPLDDKFENAAHDEMLARITGQN